jgi:polyisoprenyl-teichoic acid--peptidoglycan teichoic acid transferase
MGRTQLYYIKTKRKRFKKGRLVFLLVLCAFLITVLLSIRFINVLSSMQDNAAWTKSLPVPSEGSKEHLLLFTVSGKESDDQATEIVLAAYNPAKKDFRIIHIPTDTLVQQEEDGDRFCLGDAYSTGGTALLINTVHNLLGIPIHYFIEIDEGNLPRTIDRVGEIAIGNGGDVLNLIYAEGLSDLERFEQRRTVLAALTGRTVTGNWWQRLKALHNASPILSTNLSWRKLLFTLDSLKELKFEQSVKLLPLPGSKLIEPEGSYWQIDSLRIPYLSAWMAGDVSQMPREQVTVEVLNGSGVKGIASLAASKLEDAGFIVVRIDNADHYNYAVSQVISRVPDMDAAKDIATAMIPSADMRKEEKTDTDVMVTIIIGQNYPQD